MAGDYHVKSCVVVLPADGALDDCCVSTAVCPLNTVAKASDKALDEGSS
jgi:hypothetical protein